MTIANRATGTFVSGTATTLSPVVPAGAIVGDLLVLAIGVNTATAQTFTGLTGWTQQKNLNVNAPVLAVFTKVCVSGDIGATLAPAWTTSAASAAVVIVYSGVDQVVGPIDASSSGNAAASTTVNYGSITSPMNNTLVAFGADSGSTPGLPTSFTSRGSVLATIGMLVSDLATTAGTLTPTSTPGASSNSQGVILALRPAQVPSIRGSAFTLVGTNTAHATTTPSQQQIGDLAVAFVDFNTDPGVLTPGTGWVQVVGKAAAGTHFAAVFKKVATVAGSFADTICTSSNSVQSNPLVAFFAGAADVDVASAIASATGAVGGITTTSPNDLLVYFYQASSTITVSPQNMITLTNGGNASQNGYIATEAVPAAVATGGRSASDATSFGAVLLAVKPPSGVPVVRGAAKNQAANPSTTITATLPPNQANGDFCVVTVAWNTNPGTVTDPAGWNVIESDMTGTNGEWFKAYSKTTGVAEAAPVITWTNGNVASTTATCLTSGSLDIDGHTITAASLTANWPSVTSPHAADLLLFVAHADNTVLWSTPYAGHTTLVNNSTTGLAGVWYEMQGTAAATGARTVSMVSGSGDNTGYVIAIAGASAPNADTLVAPTNGGFLDVSGGVTFQSTYNATDGANANAYALRAKQAGGSYVYWNAGSSLWQGTIVWNALSTAPSATRSISVPASATIANGFTLNWSMASQESLGGLQGPFASDFTIVMQVAPVLSVTAPTGTIATLTPTVAWTTTPGAGTVQTAYRVIVYSPAQYGGGGFTPGVTAGVFDSGVLGGAASSYAIPAGNLTAGLAYRFYVQVTETGGETSSWQFTTATVTLDPPADPTITATPGTDGSTGAPRTAVVVQGRDNFLTANQASLETDTSGWAVDFNCAIARDASQAFNGNASLKLTASASTTAMSATTTVGTGGVPVLPGVVYTAVAYFKSAATVRGVRVKVAFFDSGGAQIGSSLVGTTVNDTTSGWTQVTATVTSPAGAAFAAVKPEIPGAVVAGEIHWVDAVDIGPGSSTVWTRGGLNGLTSAVVQFSDDGGVTWTNLRTSGSAIPWPSQTLTVYDYEAPPGVVRQYRAQVQANVGAIIASGIVTASATGTIPAQWVLSDPTDPTSGLLFHATSAPTRNLVEHEAIHAPLGRSKQVRVSDGTKGWAGRLQVRTLTTAAESALEALLARNVTLLVQSPEGGGRQWYANLSADPTVSQNERTLGVNVRDGVAGRGTTRMPHSDVSLTYVEAERP